MPNEYSPDKWMIVEIKGADPHYRVFGTWSGSYLGTDSWQMNSGIVAVEEDDEDYVFVGSSGSRYKCYKEMYGTTVYGAGILKQFKERHGDKFIVHADQPDVMNTDWIITA